jgi:hypothetical protein
MNKLKKWFFEILIKNGKTKKMCSQHYKCVEGKHNCNKRKEM